MGRAGPGSGGLTAALLLAGCSVTVSATDASSADAGFADRAVLVDAGVATDDGLARPDLPAPDDVGAPREDRPDAPAADVPGASCETATELRDGDVLRGQRIDTARSEWVSCQPGDGSLQPIRWYRLTVPAGTIMTVGTAGEGDARARFGVGLVSACGGVTECLGSGYDVGEPPLVRYHNETTGPRTVFARVVPINQPDGSSAAVSARLLAPAANATCATATPLTPGVTLRGQNLAAATGMLRSCFDGSDLRGTLALYYSITVPPRTSLVAATEIDMEPDRYSYVHVNVRPPCGTPGCLPGVGTGRNISEEYVNLTADPQPVIISVLFYTRNSAPVIAVTATLRPLP